MTRHDCYFFAPKGKYLWLYQGQYFCPTDIRPYDMSDRIERMKFLNVVSETFKHHPPSYNDHWREERKKEKMEREKTAKAKVLVRKDMNGVIEEKKGSAARNAVKRYIKKKEREVGHSRLSVSVLSPEADDELMSGI